MASGGQGVEAGPGHNNNPTINIVDDTTRQEYKLVPVLLEGHRKTIRDLHGKITDHVEHLAEKLVKHKVSAAAHKISGKIMKD